MADERRSDFPRRTALRRHALKSNTLEWKRFDEGMSRRARRTAVVTKKKKKKKENPPRLGISDFLHLDGEIFTGVKNRSRDFERRTVRENLSIFHRQHDTSAVFLSVLPSFKTLARSLKRGEDTRQQFAKQNQLPEQSQPAEGTKRRGGVIKSEGKKERGIIKSEGIKKH